MPLHFAKINARDGFFILGREPQDTFDWETLRGARVIPVGFSPMPWASFQYALRRHGLEPSDLDLRTGLSLPDAEAAFSERGGGVRSRGGTCGAATDQRTAPRHLLDSAGAR